VRCLFKWAKKPVFTFFTAATQLFPKAELVSAVYCQHVLVMELIAALEVKRQILLTKETSSCKNLGR